MGQGSGSLGQGSRFPVPGQSEDGKVAVWTENVSEVLMLVYRLYEIAGVKAFPIFGRTNKDKHLTDFVRKVKKECVEKNENPLSKLATDSAFQYVSQFFNFFLGQVCTKIPSPSNHSAIKTSL